MKITIIQTGQVPEPLRAAHGLYPPMFARMFESAGLNYAYETIPVSDGAAFPDPGALEAIVITGSAAGVYDELPWLEPLRAFIREAYARKTPMVGICFGHQIMADALGGDVRKSEKGWGLGRHVYEVVGRPGFMDDAPVTLSIACSHQDQVIAPPADAEVILRTEFAPNAGLYYANGAAMSLQPHPEFDADYAAALAELRRGKAPDAVIDIAISSLSTPADNNLAATYIGRFLSEAAGRRG